MSTPNPLADCCPQCSPFEAEASLPVGEPVEEPGHSGSLRAAYECVVCGHRWTCWWDARSSEWPLTREAAA